MERPIDLSKLTSDEFREFFQSFDTIITDCDGVLYLLYKPFPGIPETLDKLKELKKDIYFLSNNTTLNLENFTTRLNSVGISAKKEEILFPTLAIIDYLKDINFEKKIFFIGFQNSKEDYEKAGLKIADSVPAEITESVSSVVPHLTDDLEIGAVIVDMDINLNYLKLLKAALFLRRPDVLFLAGINDNRIIISNYTILGPGYFYKILEDFTGREAMVFGKPSNNLVKYINKTFQLKNPKRILFIGDSLEHDMRFAHRCGFQKLFVLSGLNKLEEIKKSDESLIPDYYISCLADLKNLIEKHL